jgi:adenylosuccinate synthase
VGAQWGDEGKGKVTDLICSDYDYCVRYQGGNNAGHTVVAGGHTLALHLVPSGVMYDNVVPVIGNGCVVDPKVLLDEMAGLEAQGISCERLRVSANAQMIMPYHVALDGAAEDARAHKVGTTKRGIGPAYQSKAARSGLRLQDLLDLDGFRERLGMALDAANRQLTAVYGCPALDFDQIYDDYRAYADQLHDKICDTSLLLNTALESGGHVLFEGAQGTLLDLDHGTYPYVTSSTCTAGGATYGSGVGPTRIDRVLGIAKAYVTRVGEGPFPTELSEESGAGEVLSRVGHEVGVTTGRSRRCGWYDAPIIKYAVRVNGLTDLALTKLDILGEFSEIKVCTSYRLPDGSVCDTIPMLQSEFAAAEPIYESLPGWQSDISGCRSFEELPLNAQNYVRRLEELAGVPISLIAVGPDRDETILCGW